MNRNVESHFAELPSVDVQRSIFDRSAGHMTTFNCGQVIPFWLEEHLPGDTFKVSTSKIVRMTTLLSPVLGNIYLDVYYFDVPYRLIYSRWKEFCGENTAGAWVPQVEYPMPTISAPSGGFSPGSLADYMGLPVGVDWDNSAENAPSALPFRAYALICNEFFRDENLTDPLNIPMSESNQTGTNGSSYITDVANGGAPFVAAKYHDYFTSCLPSPQKAAQPVSMTMQYSGRWSPVYPRSEVAVSGTEPLRLVEATTQHAGLAAGHYPISGSSDGTLIASSSTASGGDNPPSLQPANLWTDMLGHNVSFTVNELRLAFQLQKYYEKLARTGSRYIETIKALFGVTSPDARIQRPEYLGGSRIQLNVHEVTNTAQGTQDFLGDVGAKSVTTDVHDEFVKSFTEDGIVVGVMVARYDHSYSQGIEKFWLRKKYTDFYKPVFANIGEQPVDTCEICATAANMASKTTFGFNEAWADYRFKPDRASGMLRPYVNGALSHWTLADAYASAPTLSDGWIREDKGNIDRVLSVSSATSPQFWADIYVKNIATRPMPMYSIPGLIDHH